MSLPDLEILKPLVKTAAEEILLKGFGNSDFECKDDGSVVTPADYAMQDRLVRELKQLWPEFEILGEEMAEDEQMGVINREAGYWCIDPLDGTTNYAAGLPFFSVSIALILNRQQEIGLIYDPVRDEMFTAIKGQGAYLNGQRIEYPAKQVKSNKPVVAMIDLKRLPRSLKVKLMTENIFAAQRNIGSSAIEWCWVSDSRFDIYLNGGQKLWDYAAGSLIFSEAGGHSVSLDGDPVFRGQFEGRSVLACHDKELFDYWYDWIGIGQ
jgi:myo-inositol-1(or 4)-monophosphatase